MTSKLTATGLCPMCETSPSIARFTFWDGSSIDVCMLCEDATIDALGHNETYAELHPVSLEKKHVRRGTPQINGECHAFISSRSLTARPSDLFAALPHDIQRYTLTAAKAGRVDNICARWADTRDFNSFNEEEMCRVLFLLYNNFNHDANRGDNNARREMWYCNLLLFAMMYANDESTYDSYRRYEG